MDWQVLQANVLGENIVSLNHHHHQHHTISHYHFLSKILSFGRYPSRVGPVFGGNVSERLMFVSWFPFGPRCRLVLLEQPQPQMVKWTGGTGGLSNSFKQLLHVIRHCPSSEACFVEPDHAVWSWCCWWRWWSQLDSVPKDAQPTRFPKVIGTISGRSWQPAQRTGWKRTEVHWFTWWCFQPGSSWAFLLRFEHDVSKPQSVVFSCLMHFVFQSGSPQELCNQNCN